MNVVEVCFYSLFWLTYHFLLACCI